MIKLIFTLLFLLSIYSQERIVSIGHVYTDLLIELGFKNNIVATDISSKNLLPYTHSIGNSRRLSIEAIIDTKTDLVIMPGSAGPDFVKEKLKNMKKLKLIEFEDIISTELLYSQIDSLGLFFHEKVRSDELKSRLQEEFNKQLTEVHKVKKKVRGLFIYARGSSLIFVAGKNTSAAESMKLSGIQNAVNSFSAYRPLTAEAVIEANPDYIVMLKSGSKSLGGTESVFKLPGLSLTKAGKEKNIILVDDISFLSIGLKTYKEVKRIFKDLYAN